MTWLVPQSKLVLKHGTISLQKQQKKISVQKKKKHGARETFIFVTFVNTDIHGPHLEYQGL